MEHCDLWELIANTLIVYVGSMVSMVFLHYVWFKGGVCKSNARLDGKVVVITGSNTGIGKETALDLASRGAKVIMACRSKARALPALKDVVEASGNKNVEFMELDLSSLKSVRDFFENFNSRYDRLDILVNNAAVALNLQTKTADGFEMQMGTNHLGHFLLTNLLLVKLKNATEARIVNVSSIGHQWFGEKIDLDNLMMENNYDRIAQYGNSKMANVLFTKELARRLENTKVTTYAVHPGPVDTELIRNIGDMWIWKIFGSFYNSAFFPLKYVYKTPKEGAQTSIYCAVSEDCKKETGLYYADCAVKEPSQVAKDAELAARLWTISEKLVSLS